MTRPGLQIPPSHGAKGRVLSAARFVLQRLLAPMLSRFLAAHDELRGTQEAHARRIESVAARLDRLTEETDAANALVWDQLALSRRLAELEDRLAELEARAERPAARDPENA